MLFKNNLIYFKYLRKYFSLDWTIRKGNLFNKKILKRHSLKVEVDLMHYTCWSEDNLQRIYDKFMYKT